MLNKDFKSFIKDLIPKNSSVICIEPKSERATNKEILSRYLNQQDCKTLTASGLQEAIVKARSFEHDLIVITGSLYLIGEALDLVSKKQIKELNNFYKEIT